MDIKNLFTSKTIGIQKFLQYLSKDKLDLIFKNTSLTPFTEWKKFCEVLDINISDYYFKEDGKLPKNLVGTDFDDIPFIKMLLNSEEYIDTYIYCLDYYINFEKFVIVSDDNEKLIKFPCCHTIQQKSFLDSSPRNKCPECNKNIYRNDEFCEEMFWSISIDFIFYDLYREGTKEIINKYLNCFLNVLDKNYKRKYYMFNNSVDLDIDEYHINHTFFTERIIYPSNKKKNNLISSINFCQDYDINLYDFLNYLNAKDFKDLDKKYLKLLEDNLIKNVSGFLEHRNYYQIIQGLELDNLILKIINIDLTSVLDKIIETFCYEDTQGYEYVNFKKSLILSLFKVSNLSLWKKMIPFICSKNNRKQDVLDTTLNLSECLNINNGDNGLKVAKLRYFITFYGSYFKIPEFRPILNKIFIYISGLKEGYRCLKILDNRTDQNYFNDSEESSFTPLLECSRYGCYKTFKYLLSKNVDTYVYGYGECMSFDITSCAFMNSDARIFNHIVDSIKIRDNDSWSNEGFEYDLFIKNFSEIIYTKISDKNLKVKFKLVSKLLDKLLENDKQRFNELYFNILMTSPHGEKNSSLFNNFINKTINKYPKYIINNISLSFSSLYEKIDHKFKNYYIFSRVLKIVNYDKQMIMKFLMSLLDTYCICDKRISLLMDHLEIDKDIDSLKIFGICLSRACELKSTRHKHCYIKFLEKLKKYLNVNTYYNFKYSPYKIRNFDAIDYTDQYNMFNHIFTNWTNHRNDDLFDALVVSGFNLPDKPPNSKENTTKWYLVKLVLKRFIRRRERNIKDRLKKKIHNINTQIIHYPNIENNQLYNKLGTQFKKNLYKFNPQIKPPQHVSPSEMINLNRSNIIVSEKADGITFNDYDFCDVSPKIDPEILEYNIQCEYIEKLNIYVIFDIHNHIEYISDSIINSLRHKHPFVNNSTDNKQLIDKDVYLNYVDQERKSLENYCTYLKETNSVGWWPKKIWRVEYEELLKFLDNFDLENFPSSYPCDGIIIKDISTLDTFKLKPYKKLTLDLMYTEQGWTTSDGDIIRYVDKDSKEINSIWRCYWINDIWVPKDLRTDKSNPNTSLIEQFLTNQHLNKWYIKDLHKIIDIIRPYYHTDDIKTKTKYVKCKLDTFIDPNSSILDIGCGKIDLKYKNYTGIDIDLNIISKKELSNRFLWLDFSKPWTSKDQEKFFGKNIWKYMNVDLTLLDKKFDNILIINSIQYSSKTDYEWNNFIDEISNRSKQGTKLLIRCISEKKIQKLFDNIVGDVINKFPSFVRKINPPKKSSCKFWIKYYYDWCHKNPIEEPVVPELYFDRLGSKGWKKIFEITENTKTEKYAWDEYMNCFTTSLYIYS